MDIDLLKFGDDSKTLILIDGNSVDLMCKTLRQEIDWKKFKEQMKDSFNVRRIFYHIVSNCDEQVDNEDDGDTNNSGNNYQVHLRTWLSFNGYQVEIHDGNTYLKKDKIISNNGDKIQSYLMHSDLNESLITNALVGAYSGIEHIIILTSNDAFVPLARALRKTAVTISLISNSHSYMQKLKDENSIQSIGRISKKLNKECDNFIELDSLMKYVAKDYINGDKED